MLRIGCLVAFAAVLATPAAAQRVLRVGIDSVDVAQLDPHRASATDEKVPVGWMFGGLVRFPPGSADPAALEPDLAQSWEHSADGLTWTFHLRPGVAFHGDWGEATADDAVYSLHRAADPKRSSFAANYRAVASVEALDARTVRLVLKNPVPALLGLVANYHGGMVVSRRADEALGAKFAQSPVGFGPFAYADHITQGELVLDAHKAYFRGAPRIDRIRYRFIASDATRELAFTAGEIDLFQGKREQRWVERMRTVPGAVVDVYDPGEFRTLHINARAKPLDDRRVREAVLLAVDTAQLIRFVGPDVAAAARSVVPPGSLGEVDVHAPKPDLARAKALLAEAGYAQGLTLHTVVSRISAQLPVMEVIQAQLKRIGIALDMEVVDHAAYHSKIRQDASALVFYGAARFPVADAYLSEFYHSRAEIGAPQQITNFSHCRAADAEIDAAAAESDAAKQLALWATAQHKIADAICSVPLFDLRQVWVRRTNVKYGYELKGALNLGPPIIETTVVE